MRTSLQFFKDMGVCDGAYAVLERVFQSAGVTEFDYAAGYEMMLGMMGELEIAAAQSGEPGHDTAQGWLKWCYDLRTRPEAIMYFGDHIEENLFRTADGHLYETLAAAQDHRRRSFAEQRRDHAAARVINGKRSLGPTFCALTTSARPSLRYDRECVSQCALRMRFSDRWAWRSTPRDIGAGRTK